MAEKKNSEIKPMKIYNESYTVEENQLIDKYLADCSETELATLLDIVCRDLLGSSHPDFLSFYQEQINMLYLHKKHMDKFAYNKKYINYLEKMISYKTDQNLHQPFLDEYNEYKKKSGLSREQVEDIFIAKTASKYLGELKKTSDKYKEFIENVYAPNNFISCKKFLEILKTPRKNTKSKEPIRPTQEISNSAIDVLKIMKRNILTRTLVQMIALLDKEDISSAYPFWIFTVAFLRSSNHNNHTSKERSYVSPLEPLSDLMEENKKMEIKIEELEKILKIAE